MSPFEVLAGTRPISRCKISGRVDMGRQLGRTIGFPTANIAMDEESTLPHGIYVSLVRLDGGKRRGSVSYVGRRPTVYGTSLLLETHIFDFAQNIYGAFATVEIYDQIRGDAFFPDLASLTDQIEQDCLQARRRLKALLQPAPAITAWRPHDRVELYSGLVA